MRMATPNSLYRNVFDKAGRFPDAPAILAVTGKAISYQRLFEHLQTTTLILSQMGFHKGDRLAVVLPNGPEMASAFLSVSSVCTCAPLNPSYPADEYKFSLTDLHIKALLTSFGEDHPACRAASELGIPILKLQSDNDLPGIFRLQGDFPLEKAIVEPSLVNVDDIALVLHTSGTTSRPKIVPLTHENIFHSVTNIAETYALSPADRCLNLMPLFHVHGLMGAFASSLFVGASVICAPGYSPNDVLRWLIDLAPTWYTAVPTIHQSILDQIDHQPETAKEIRLRFIRSCSSPLSPKTAKDMEDAYNTPVLEAYGMTEATHQMASNPLPPKPRKFGSVGLATGSTKITILDEQGFSLPNATVGEIGIQGENVMQGYENNQAANTASFANGWLRTGDLGYLDEDGYLFIQGRSKELINRGGEKISPREIDDILLCHPSVAQAVTFAVPHPTLGEDVAAAVVLRDEKPVSPQQLRQFVATRLADFKIPRKILFVQEIPKGPTGKIQRIGLAEKLKPELDSMSDYGSRAGSLQMSLIEDEILSIWRDVLGDQNISINDDFLSIGGDSIQAARILARVNESFATDLQLSDIFTASTVSLMAEVIQASMHQDHSHE